MTIYFKTYEQAQQVRKAYDGQEFPNVYQHKGESTAAEIREFKKGFAIQFGDCGAYLTKQDYLSKATQ